MNCHLALQCEMNCHLPLKCEMNCHLALLDRTRRARVAPACPLGRRLGRHFSVCRSKKFAPSAQNLPHIQFGSLQPVFSLRTMRCKTFRKKVAKKCPKTGSRPIIPSMGKSGFFIDFQDFLKIDVEIIQCQEVLKPVLLLFSKSSEIIYTDYHSAFQCFFINFMYPDIV